MFGEGKIKTVFMTIRITDPLLFSAILLLALIVVLAAGYSYGYITGIRDGRKEIDVDNIGSELN